MGLGHMAYGGNQNKKEDKGGKGYFKKWGD